MVSLQIFRNIFLKFQAGMNRDASAVFRFALFAG